MFKPTHIEAVHNAGIPRTSCCAGGGAAGHHLLRSGSYCVGCQAGSKHLKTVHLFQTNMLTNHHVLLKSICLYSTLKHSLTIKVSYRLIFRIAFQKITKVLTINALRTGHSLPGREYGMKSEWLSKYIVVQPGQCSSKKNSS